MTLARTTRATRAIAIALITALVAPAAWSAGKNEKVLARGAYLVNLAGCADCHTPGQLLGKPDAARFLGGSDVGFAIPGMGVFYGPNLTPDAKTGLGGWTTQQIVTAMTTGKRPDGRQLSPAMPYPAFQRLTPDDAKSIAMYLQSLPPVQNKVPGPFGANDKPTSFVMTVVPPDVYSNLPKPLGK